MQLINTGPEPFFEDVVNHMAAICHVPVAIVAIADPRRKWINQPGQEKGREAATFGLLETLGGARAVVNDMSLDERFAKVILPADAPQIRAFICQPLIIDDIEIGSLYLADTVPHEWTEFEISYLARSARLIGGHFGTRVLLAERTRRIELERQLAETNALYRAVVSAMNEGVIVRTVRGDVIVSNEAARNIVGVSESKIRSQGPDDTRWTILDTNGKPLPTNLRPTMLALTTGQPQVQKLVGIQRPNGEIRWCHVNATPMWSGMSLKPTHVVTTFDDVTEKFLAALEKKKAAG